ncbi:hypothetical protein DCAR_0310306 [Daucus carota subsp. sativus]|uniref:NB-ARC domain-containing protein n=1 Tax=Daucus carota subsp. sativus TaxID=79200 RepID=A0AAF0WMN7_DAUCS|nr:hypothetical protein DCAR_0310306 [Daucus carota subsp. sativus]
MSNTMELGLNEKFIELYEKLKDEAPKTIVIYGESGVGKTWMAKKLSDHAVEDGSFDLSIWIFMCRDHDMKALRDTVARQMSIQLEYSDEWEMTDEINEDEKKEAANDKKDSKKDEEMKKKEEEDRKKKGEEEKMKKEKTIKDLMDRAISEKKRILFVLDDEGSKVKQGDIMADLENLLHLEKRGIPFKVLVTRVTSGEAPDEFRFELKALADQQLSSFLVERIGDGVPGLATWAKDFHTKCKSLSIADIIVLAKALCHFGKDGSWLKQLDEKVSSFNDKYNVMQLLFKEYDPLPSIILLDFLYKGDLHYFLKSRSVHYNELITYWILEGYLGNISSIQKAFEKGHSIVMELIECHMLKELEGGYVIINRNRVSGISDWRDMGFHETVTIGLATVFDDNWTGFGRITHKDGVIRTLFKDNKGKNLSTLLLDGNYFGVEDLNKFLKYKGAQVLAVFHPTMTELPESVSALTKLDILVLRGCDYLEKFDHTLQSNLTVLEISGATSLTKLPEDLFKAMRQLRSLNLSQLKIESLPSSLFELKEIKWLILRECSCLKSVSGSLRNLEHLLHLDLSYASSFESFLDTNFHFNKKLQILDVSKTKIKTLPLLKELKKLTHLLLSDCADLDRLRSIAPLTSLQTLDISGATKFKEFHDLSLEMVGELKIINLSDTSLELLPSHISHPRQLFLKRCLKLKQLECMDSLEKLEILDLSGSTQLSAIEDDFFDTTTSLQELNLSETKVKKLPSLSKLQNLRQLLLSHCESLQELPDLNGLVNLEELDASNCTALKVIPDQSFEKMSRLQKLDLSNTKIESLPTLPNPGSLQKLLLQNCMDLKKFPSDIMLPKLEELNLSGVDLSGDDRAAFLKDMSDLKTLNLSETNVQSLPSMSNLKNLNALSLRGCKHLEVVPDLAALTNLEALDLSGTAVNGIESLRSFKNLRQFHSSTKDFLDVTLNTLLSDTTTSQLPDEILDLPHLELLELPTGKQDQEVDTTESEKTSPELPTGKQNQEVDTTESEKTSLELPTGKQNQEVDTTGSEKTSLELPMGKQNQEADTAEPEKTSLELPMGKQNQEVDTAESKKTSLELPMGKQNQEADTTESEKTSLELPTGKQNHEDDTTEPEKTSLELPTGKQNQEVDTTEPEKTSLELPKGKQNQEVDTTEPEKTSLELPTGKQNQEVDTTESEKTSLELPTGKQNQEVDTTESEKTRGDVNKQQWMMSSWPVDLEVHNDKHGLYVSCARLDELLEDPSLWDTGFKQFHFLVSPLNQLNEKKDYKKLYKMELIFRSICIQAWQFVHPMEQVRSLEIRGFQHNPASLEVILHHAEVVYIIDNPFITSFLDFGAEHIKNLKVCWIERCDNIKSIFDAEKMNSTAEPEQNTNMLEDNLEIISVSNAPNLKGIVLGNLHGILKNLKCLHLDCCPNIPTLFGASQKLESLEVLEIKFCDGLKTLFEDESVHLPKLKNLHLRALPNLEKVGCVAPKLESLQVVDCPKLVTVLSTSTNLKVLHVKCCEKMTSVFNDKQSNSTLPQLQELHLWGLPVMSSIGANVPFLKKSIVRECPVLEDDLRSTDTK